MPKRKKPDTDSTDADLSVPIPIQTFLWRQTSPFVRRKLGKLCEASCVSFERVLVQNIVHGLSPSLCEAISSISRWKMVQASFPHVMHCCASLLQDKKRTDPDGKFTGNQTKLLYTLHWIIMDAASECEDADLEKGQGKGLASYLHSLDTVQLFVYLLAPLIHILKDSDFQSLKLEPGLRLWQPLWEFRQPDVLCFSTAVKGKRVILKAQRGITKVNFNTANIYIGKGTSNDDMHGIYMGGTDDNGIYLGGGDEDSLIGDSATPQAPLAHMSDICAWSTTETATSVDISCEVCSQSVQNRNGEMSCGCGTRRSSRISVQVNERKSSLAQALPTIIDHEYVTHRLESCIANAGRSSNPDVLSASYFDVAVLRCLFCPQWSEDGVFWALKFIHQRLLEILDESNHNVQERLRSNSLPIPEQEPFLPAEEPPVAKPPNLIEEPNYAMNGSRHRSSSPEKETRKEPAFKRIKVSEIKHMNEYKVKSFRLRDSNEQLDNDKPKKSADNGLVSTTDTFITNNNEISTTKYKPIPQSSQESCDDNISDNEECDSNDSGNDVTRNRSAPAWRRQKYAGGDEDDQDDVTFGGKTNSSGDKGLTTKSGEPFMQKPIIKVTCDSPEMVVPAMSSWLQKRPSTGSQRSEKSDKSESSRSTRESKSMHRSSTDSKINYGINDEIEEVPGSVFYINSRGHLKYEVILQAAHAVVMRECTPRMCGVLLNILNCLIDLNVINKTTILKGLNDDSVDDDDDDIGSKKQPPSNKPHSEKRMKAPFILTIETVVRIFRVIGCPHGCGDSCGSEKGSLLRAQAIDLMSRLMKLNKPEVMRYVKKTLLNDAAQEVVDFLHAFLGFCVDPNTTASAAAGLQSPQEKPGRKTSSDNSKTGYATNFGQPVDGSSTVESQIIVHILEPLISKFCNSSRDINSPENIGLYCDVRQFINYAKDLHGGVFRKVALGGLRDVTRIETITVHSKEPPSAKPSKIGAGPRRRSSMVPSGGGSFNEQDIAVIAQVAAAMGEDVTSGGRARKPSLFKRNKKKNLLPPQAASDSDIFDDSSKSGASWSPRVSVSANEDNDPSSGQGSPKHTNARFSRGNVVIHTTE